MPIYFCHVPRTGGTTISHILTNRYFGIKVSSPKIPDKINVECMWGHFNYTPLAGTWVTFIREPKARLISLYNHYLRKVNPKLEPENFFDIIGPNPMIKQLGKEPENFDFIGVYENFESDIYKLNLFLDLGEFKIRKTHEQKNKIEIEIPENFISDDLAFYRKVIQSKN